jgi:putative phosphoribosyl transferase
VGRVRPASDEIEVEFDAGSIVLHGTFALPENPVGVVVFAHGSGSSRHSPRNRFVASRLNDAGLATLLLDLLTTEEELDRENVFDVALLAARVCAATRWLTRQPAVAPLPVGCFGASTGAAAALWAAADRESRIHAVVSRGGRPDLARTRLAAVRAPTLLIVGSLDRVVLDLNREAARLLGGETRVEVVPGATHLFEEPGALEVVADLASRWFREHLARAYSAVRP